MPDHDKLPFGSLHKARLTRGTAAQRLTDPRGPGDLYFAEDTQVLSIGNAEGTAWVEYDLFWIDKPRQLTDLEDVSSAEQTGSYVLATPSVTGGDYEGRILVVQDIPNLDISKITSGMFGQDQGATGRTTYTPGDIFFVDKDGILTVLPLGTHGQILRATIEDIITPNNRIFWSSQSVTYSNFRGARVYNSSNQSLAQSNDTYLTWDTETYDTDACWDVSDPSRLTCKTAGTYHIAFHGSTSTSYAATGGNVSIFIVLNGLFTSNNVLAMRRQGLNLATQFPLAVNDYVEILVRVGSIGTSLVLESGIQTAFMMEKINGD